VLRARCLSYGQEISLWLIADLLRSLLGITEGDRGEEIHIKLAAAVSALLVHCAGETEREATDVLGEVVGLPPWDSPVAQAGPQIRRQALLRSLKLLLSALSERAPTVIVLEDVHWIDAASAEIINEVLSDLPGLRLLALVAQRPGWNAPWSEWGWTERLTLRPLREGEARRLAGAVLGGVSLSPQLEAYVAERAGGNPFFVEELLRALEESGGLVQRDGVMQLAPGAAQRLPSTLTEVLLARLDRLEGQVRSAAQVASVIGRSFAVRLLARVMEREQTDLELPLSALRRAEIAFPRSGSDLEYVFKHVTMREVAYNTLVQKRRQALHLQTARAIAALYPSDEYVEILAYHFGKTQEPEAAAWLEKAGDRAAAVYANEEALGHYREALRRVGEYGTDERVLARLDEKVGAVLYLVSRLDEAIAVLDRAIQTYRKVQDLEGAGRVAAVLGNALNARGTLQEGLARVEPMVALLAGSGPSPALAALHLSRAINFHNLGRYEEMLTAAEQAADIAKALGDQRLVAWSLERRGTALIFLGRAAESRPILDEAVMRLERVGDLLRLQTALINLGEAHRVTGNLEEARHYNERALVVCERIGNPVFVAQSLVNLGEILLTVGHWKMARERLDRAEAVQAALSSTSVDSAYIPIMVGQILLATGDWEEAEAHLLQALCRAETAGVRLMLEVSHRALAELEILRGDVPAAIRRLEPLAGREGGFQVLIDATLAWAHLEASDVVRAAHLAAGAVDRARDTGELLALVDALRVKGTVRQEQGQRDEADAIFEEGLALARSLPAPYSEARILVGLGRLEEASLIFRQLGAKKDVERMERALAEPA